jgi:mannose-1-phosphate guanylyltransferase
VIVVFTADHFDRACQCIPTDHTFQTRETGVLYTFKEKPNAETTERYPESGRHLWNSGMFVWIAEAIYKELISHLRKHVD